MKITVARSKAIAAAVSDGQAILRSTRGTVVKRPGKGRKLTAIPHTQRDRAKAFQRAGFEQVAVYGPRIGIRHTV